MEEAEKRGRRFPRKKPIVRPQRNPIEWRANLTQIKNPRRHGRERHRRERA